MNKIILLIALTLSCFQLNAQQNEKFEIELLNQIHIDYLIDMGLNVKIANNINRDELISQDLFKSLLQDTPFIKKHPEKVNQLSEMTVEMNGQFVFDKSMYEYNFSSLNKLINYSKKNGDLKGSIDLNNNSKAWWLIPMGIASCAAGQALCHANCRANCDALGVITLNSTCWLCGGFADCTCKQREYDGFGF